MMIGNDYINASISSFLDFSHITNSAIYCNKKFCAVSNKFFYSIIIETKAFIVPVRNIICKILKAYFFEKIMKYYCAWNAISVIVTINHSFLFVRYSLNDSLYNFIHI